MLALAFCFTLFIYWSVVGRALISLAYPRLGILRSWLLAPGLGLSYVLLGLMILNQAGVPIRTFAIPFTAASGIAALVVLVWRRPTMPWRSIAPFVLAILFALLWTGWPAFETGFNWISYANDDMANYCLAAQRFTDFGFYDVPSHAALAGRDYAEYYFFMHVADMMRFGSEHLVAWTSCLARVKATQAFMSTILALALVQIASAGALVLYVGRNRRLAAITVWILAASPLFMLGTLYELIAQVAGIALLLTVLSLLLRRWTTPRRHPLIRFAALTSMTAAALCITYPEVTPFVVLTFLACGAGWMVQRRQVPVGFIAIAAYTLVGVIVLLRHNLISYVAVFVLQFNGAMQSSNLLLSLFPYFMIPTGFSNLFGWMPIAYDFPEPVLSGSIAAGMLLAVVVLIRGVRDSWRLAPMGILLIIQAYLAYKLYTSGNDFGLYKLAMWMQPALAASIAGLLVWSTRRRRKIAVVLTAVYALSAAPTAIHYTDASRGRFSGGLTELRLASQLGLHPKLPADHDAQLTGLIENVVAAKLAASELRGRPLALLARDFFEPVVRTDLKHPMWSVKLQPHFPAMMEAVPLMRWRKEEMITTGQLWKTQFSQPAVEKATDDFLSLDPELSLFNKFDADLSKPPHDSVFVVEAANTVHNRLVFVHSGLGNHYYLGDRRRIAFFQQEQDLFAPGREFNGIGRFMLLRIENPSPKVYVRIAATRTALTGRTAWSPKAVVHGATDLPLDPAGNGAFNLFIGPLAPQHFADASYLAVDFAEIPRQLIDYRTGLKRLYGRRVALDYRRIIGWARDVSAISETEYAHLQRPRSISNFPHDLAEATTLEFSGAYDDGWLSPHARFVLDGARPGELVRVRGMIPEMPGTRLGTGTVRISINDTPMGELPAHLGGFDWLLPVPNRSAKTTIDLEFSVAAVLPGRDQRPIATRLEYLGLVDASAGISYDYNTPDTPRLAGMGVDQDGWLQHHSEFVLPTSETPLDVELRLEDPGWSGSKPDLLHVTIDGVKTKDLPLVPGQVATLSLRLSASAVVRRIRLDAPDEFPLPPPDNRRRSLRLLSVHLVPPARTHEHTF